MLITLDPQWTEPDWDGIKVLVLLPETPAPAGPDHARDDWRVFHFTHPRGPLAILQTVIDRLARHRQLNPDALLFSVAAPDPGTCAQERDHLATAPFHTTLVTGPDNRTIERLVIGPGYTSHPAFARFIRNLSPIDALDPAEVLANMAHYLGPEAA